MRGKSRIITLRNGYHVWTRCVGEGPVPILLLHGGPGGDHEYLECLSEHVPLDQYRLYYYDQLGSYFSDQPDDISLWTVDRFRDEVEEVRDALGLDQMILYGQSWGGMLGMEYALHDSGHLMGLVISNMVASVASYVNYLQQLRQSLPAPIQEQMAQYESRGEYQDPEYLALVEQLYQQHLCRLNPWPVAVARSFEHINAHVYETMQGPNEFVVTGTFKNWDRWEDLPRIGVPTLILGGRYDTMNPEDLCAMARAIPRGRASICPNGSHMAMWDDQDHYYPPLLKFLAEVSG